MNKELYIADEQKTTILLVLTEDSMTIIFLDCQETMAAQKLIEILKNHQQVALFMAALSPRLHDLMKDINGNHAIQHSLTWLRTEGIKFIFNYAIKHCVKLAILGMDVASCNIAWDCSTEELQADSAAKVSSHGLKLTEDDF